MVMNSLMENVEEEPKIAGMKTGLKPTPFSKNKKEPEFVELEDVGKVPTVSD